MITTSATITKLEKRKQTNLDASYTMEHSLLIKDDLLDSTPKVSRHKWTKSYGLMNMYNNSFIFEAHFYK
jgi:hypothetical protein